MSGLLLLANAVFLSWDYRRLDDQNGIVIFLFGDTHSCQTQDEFRTSGYQRSITNPWAHVSALIYLCSSMVLSSVYSTQDSRGTHAPPSLAPLLSGSSIPHGRPSSRDGWTISSNSFRDNGSTMPTGTSYQCLLLILMDVMTSYSFRLVFNHPRQGTFHLPPLVCLSSILPAGGSV